MDNKAIQDEPMPKQLINAIVSLDKAISIKQKNVDKIERCFPDERLITEEYNIRKKQLGAVNKKFEYDWLSALRFLDDLCKKIRQSQPHLDKLTSNDINDGTSFPDAIALGRMLISYQDWSGLVPRLIPFPIRKSLYIAAQNTEHQVIHQLLLRLVHCIPVGNVEITAADPVNLGKSINPFLPLLKANNLFPEKRILTNSDELENVLGEIKSYVEDMLQNKFKGTIVNWNDYNKANPDSPLPYKILIIFDVPEQLSDKSLHMLRRLLQNGPACGVIPIITIDIERIENNKYTEFRNDLKEFCKEMDTLIPAKLLTEEITEINIVEKSEKWPSQSQLREILAVILEKYKQKSKFDGKLEDLWNDKDLWKYNAIHGIQAPIGWSLDGEIANFSIGNVNSEHHVLLGGRSGSGKSNLLHVLIHNLCHTYSPSELNIYLLDYKQGTEFNVYASPPLPQAKLVATESDPEFGISVLTHLKLELERRASLFKSKSESDYSKFRESSECELPRILLIIDEFQILFSEDRQIGESAYNLLSQLLRQGRAFGIHVLLATQTLKGIQHVSSMGELIGQIGCRIALACGEEDSAMILSNSNWEASKLNSPPEGIINNFNGVKSENQLFHIPFADRNLCLKHIEEISKLSYQIGYTNSTKIFDGSRLPKIPTPDWFCSKSNESLQIHLGEKLNFEAKPLSITLIGRNSYNILINGYNDRIHDGLLASVIQSLVPNDDIDKIIYLNGRSGTPTNPSIFLDQFSNNRIITHESVNSLNLPEFSDQFQSSQKILIIDGLDSIKEFHTLPANRLQMKGDEGIPSPKECLMKILEYGPQHGTFVIAFSENWNRCDTNCRELLPSFEMRVGFCMNEDDAGKFVKGSIAKFKGLEKDNRAIFVNRLENKLDWFRPYINEMEI